MIYPYSQGLADAVTIHRNRQQDLEARVLWLEQVVQELAQRIKELEYEA